MLVVIIKYVFPVQAKLLISIAVSKGVLLDQLKIIVLYDESFSGGKGISECIQHLSQWNLKKEDWS
jgi:hypothetical protein